MDALEVMRAEEEWQRAGAYSVRIQGMNRQHHISLREEFDEHDGDYSKYVVLLDGGYPVATCRFYQTAPKVAMLGRVVVLPEYRGQQLGRRLVGEAERWMAECGIEQVTIDARTTAAGFYQKLGYEQAGETVFRSGVFDCVRMRKTLGPGR